MPVNVIIKSVKALRERFPDAIFESEKIVGAPRYKLLIVSEAFKKMRQYRRQDAIWKVLKNTLNTDEIMMISVVLPLEPSEVRRTTTEPTQAAVPAM